MDIEPYECDDDVEYLPIDVPFKCDRHNRYGCWSCMKNQPVIQVHVDENEES